MEIQGERMPRGQWMATDGRELYHAWLVDLIDQYAGDERIDSAYSERDVFASKLSRYADELPEDHLERFIQALDGVITKQKSNDDKAMDTLLESAEDVKYYTSADDMLGESSNWPRAIEKHSYDGLFFACRVTLGLAYDAYQSAGYPIDDTVEFYERLSEIMHDPSFHRALEKFATTGFAVLTNNAGRAMLREDMSFVVSQILGLSLSPAARIVQAVHDGDGSLTYRLDPRITEKLLEHLREQNKTHAVRKVGSYTIHQRLAGRRSFTTGCPVRRAPTSEQEKGNSKSAIALFSDFIGDELVRVVGDRIRSKRDIAILALNNTSAS